MYEFSRIIVGYHGCRDDRSIEFGRRLLTGDEAIADWQQSANDNDWLGSGIYFWEHDLDRAREWSADKKTVIGALIQLGRCFDLLNFKFTTMLGDAFIDLSKLYAEQGKTLPRNTGRELKNRKLDCLVIQHLMQGADKMSPEPPVFQTVRCAFEEGDPCFAGAMLRQQTHTQICVRDIRCILGIFRPNQGV
jgi:hypothetical protein